MSNLFSEINEIALTAADNKKKAGVEAARQAKVDHENLLLRYTKRAETDFYKEVVPALRDRAGIGAHCYSITVLQLSREDVSFYDMAYANKMIQLLVENGFKAPRASRSEYHPWGSDPYCDHHAYNYYLEVHW